MGVYILTSEQYELCIFQLRRGMAGRKTLRWAESGDHPGRKLFFRSTVAGRTKIWFRRVSGKVSCWCELVRRGLFFGADDVSWWGRASWAGSCENSRWMRDYFSVDFCNRRLRPAEGTMKHWYMLLFMWRIWDSWGRPWTFSQWS